MANEAAGHPPEPDDWLGPTIARMRKAQGLTGHQLGKQVGMSQAKISRLENGIGFPDPGDVARIGRALGADEQQINHLVTMAERAHDRMTDWRPLPLSLAATQQTVGQLESEARTIRVFQPAIVAGLLQTSEYAKAVLASFQRFISPDSEIAFDARLLEAVSARVQRQEILADRARGLHVVMTEAALANRVCPPEDVLGQLRRLRDVSRQDNVTLSIIPADTPQPIAPVHGFVLLDDATVVVDLFNTCVLSRGRTDLRLYRAVFDAYEEHAVTDIEPILERYTAHYLELLRPARSAT